MINKDRAIPTYRDPKPVISKHEQGFTLI